VKDDEACGTHGREEKRFCRESLKETDNSEDRGVDGMRMDLRRDYLGGV
jgi:hypothetical protein